MNIDLRDALLFVTPLAVSALSLTAMHFFPWHRGAKPLARTTAYALGTLATVGIPALTMLLAAVLSMPQGELFWAALLLCNALVSGGAVNFCYWIDASRAISLDEVYEGTSHARGN